MIDPALARAVSEVAARAADVLHAYDPAYVAAFGDVRAAQRTVRGGDPLAAAAPDGTFFVVAADGTRRYVRDGAFALVDGRLRTRAGADVLGYPPGAAPGALPVPLAADAVDVALGRPVVAKIEPDGTVAYTRGVVDPRTMQRAEQRVVLGTVTLARLPAGTEMRRDATGGYQPPDGVVPHLGRPAEGGFGTLRTQVRGLGGVDLDRGLAKLQDAYLALHALRAAQKARLGLDRGAMDLVK